MTINDLRKQLEKVREEVEHSPNGSLALAGQALTLTDSVEAFCNELAESVLESILKAED